MAIKFAITLILLALIFSGCVFQQQAPYASQPQGSGESNNLSPAQPGAGGVPPYGDGQQPQAQKTKYLAFASLFQLDVQERSKGKDIIEKAYAVEVDIADVSGGGTGKPLGNPGAASVKLSGPSGDIYLRSGPISQQEYDALPVSGAWPVYPGYADSTRSQFHYSKNNELLPAGNYKITIDADGNGVADGEMEIVVPGVSISNPIFGSRQPESGFAVQWSQAGDPQKMIYTISEGRGFAGLDNYLVNAEPILGKQIAVDPSELDGAGNYILNFQVDSTVATQDLQDYAAGRSQKEMVFFIAGAREAHFVQFRVGQFCWCDDAFESRACTIDDIEADPLCQ